MKRSRFWMIAAAFMSLSLAACTQEDISAPNPDIPTGDNVTAYAKVRISMGGGGSTRASVGTPEFDAGTEAEGHVSSIMLVVYDNQGNVIGSGASSNSKDATGNGNSNVSDTYDDGLVVELSMTASKDQAKKVVAYVNTFGSTQNFTEASTKETSAIRAENGNFIMTNSGYYKTDTKASQSDDTWVCAAEITPGSLFNTVADAAASSTATEIYVERLAAKISLTLGLGNEPEANKTANVIIKDAEGNKYKLVFNTDKAKWLPTGTAKSMYMLKQRFAADEITDSDFKYNDLKNFRSYWAKGVNYGIAYDQQIANLDYVASNSLRKTTNGGKPFGGYDYAPEHTYGTTVINDGAYNPLGAATSVIVLGQYDVKAVDATGNATKYETTPGVYDFYLLLTDIDETYVYQIFTAEELTKYLVESNNKLKQMYVTGNTAITTENYSMYVKMVWDSENAQYTLAPASDAVNVVDEDGEAITFAGSNARHYNLGYAYFFMPIDHLAANGVGQYGVVRNHSYKFTVTEITALGTPLDDDHFGKDPDDNDPEDPGNEPVVPDPSKTAVIKAKLNVLSWHNAVNDDVKFN